MSKLKGKGSNVDAISTDIGKQRTLEEKANRLKTLVSFMPITIEFGCHTIELKFNGRFGEDDFSFEVVGEREDGGLIIETV